jgi:hypothetical protein
MSDMKSTTAAGVVFISSGSGDIVFNYFDILCTGQLSDEAKAQLEELSPSRGDTIKVVMTQKSLEAGLAASDGKTAKVGLVVSVEQF